MKKIILAIFVFGLIALYGGMSLAGPGKKHKKGKGYQKEYCKKHMKKHGPPPHAPAHGYRHNHPDGVELKFNANRNIYVVIDCDDFYFHADSFFRLLDGGWKKSKHISGPWIEAPPSILPPGLPPLPPPPPNKKLWNLGRFF